MVAGTTTYLKSMHPSWSPSTIKSVLMTTATTMKTRKKSDIKLCGSGLICIKKAVDPGLVYDIDGLDYVRLLRAQGCLDSDLYDYVEDELEKIGTDSLQPSDLNYSSFKAHLSDQKTSQVFRRRLKDVDKVYKAYVTKCLKGVEITVKPRELKFVKGQERNFEMHVAVVDWSRAKDNLFSAVLEWKSKQYTVRSPIIIERRVCLKVQEGESSGRRKGKEKVIEENEVDNSEEEEE